MNKPVAVRGARLIDPSRGVDGNYDLLLNDDGTIRAVEPRDDSSSLKNFEVVDGSGLWLLPGLVDLHVHLREPGEEYKETIASGAAAAARGGYTTACCMANTEPVNDKGTVTRFIVERGRSAGLSRILPIGAVSKGLKGTELAEMADMRNQGAVAFSDDGFAVMDSGLMRRALEYSRPLDMAVVVHEEDEGLARNFSMHEGHVSTRLGLKGQPSEAEMTLLGRDIMLTRLTRGRMHVAHLSTKGGVELVRKAKEEGLRVTAEVTPHHLWLDHEDLLERPYDPDLKMAPPLRTDQDRRALREALADGTIDAVATDHAPHYLVEKEHAFADCAKGVVGMGSGLGLTLRMVDEGLIGLHDALSALTWRAARCFDLPYGTLRPGAPGDFILVDPEARWELGIDALGGISRNSPFLGWTMHGNVLSTWVEGRRVYPRDE